MRNAVFMSVIGLTLCAGSLLVLASPSVEDQIKARQSAFTYLGWNMNRIRAQVIDGDVEFNPAQVEAAATAIAAVANAGLSMLFGPGTDQGTGWKPTRLKSEFFDELEEAGEIARRFIEQSSRLAEVAAGGEKDAIARQFEATANSCGACHREYRAQE